jgi:hypothetical protein
MDIYGFLNSLSDGKVVTIKLYQRNECATPKRCQCSVVSYFERNSLYTYLGDYTNYYSIYLDEGTNASDLYKEIINIINRRNNSVIEEYPYNGS